MVFVGQMVNPPGRCGSEPVVPAARRFESGRRIANPPQVNNLPHERTVAGCEDSNNQ